jgi:diguanylate cyclase (GGDEF)-like protein
VRHSFQSSPDLAAPARILLADDDEATRKQLKALLEGAGHSVEVASSGEEALRRAAASDPEIVLLDVVMPGMSGLEACRMLKARARDRMMPVLLLVPKTDATSRARGLGAGADDWIPKPIDGQVLLTRIASLARIKRVSDEMRDARLMLERMSARDELTGLMSYRVLSEKLRELIEQASRGKDPLAAAIFDIDELESINQRLGRPAGDEVLRRLAECVAGAVRTRDVAVRYGPDAALLLLPRTGLLDAVATAEQVLERFVDRGRTTGTARAAATASAGVASFPGRDVRDAEELLRGADHAVACAKRAGGGRVCGFRQHGLVLYGAGKEDPKESGKESG